MKPIYLSERNGKRRVVWPALVAFVVVAPLAMIGSAEVFWKMFTGHYSELVGGFALVAATLLVIRSVGASIVLFERDHESGL